MLAREVTARLKTQLAALQVVAAAEQLEPDLNIRLGRLRNWQRQRLEKSFSHLHVQSRYTAAVDFFISDLYGEPDMAWRDRDIQRILPVLTRWLPASVLVTLAEALELDVISRRFDLAMARLLPLGTINVRAYAEAYRQVDDSSGRKQQIALIANVGHALERIVRKPFVLGVLKFARGPARSAGLEQLQNFLERGFAAFRKLGPAEHFLRIIIETETGIMQRLLASHPDPFGFQLEC